MSNNKYGELADLSNEASVEQFFVIRLLRDLGYKDAQIKPKASLEELQIHKGRKGEKWRPDYALVVRRKARWILEVKGVDEDLDKWVGQAASYSLGLNAQQTENPVQYYVLTNGVTTRVYRWDNQTPILSVAFRDFVDGNQSFQDFGALLRPEAFSSKTDVGIPAAEWHDLRRHSVADLNADFAWAHRMIYRRENLSYNAAFMEFVKVIFLKLRSDRLVHGSPDLLHVDDQTVSVPRSVVRFSSAWIESREQDTPNPLDAILFQNFLTEFEELILTKNKKRIFGRGEHIQLSADTIKVLVGRLEHVDLISIDADLNGRMFETFLNSTLRGKALGQYFTPRSVVKLATGMARLRADKTHVDRVIDACSGTGGFLIEAFADMTAKINANGSLSASEREILRQKVAEESLIGIDIAKDPALARIARINMFLHGDGGTSIFQLDALDKKVRASADEDPELVQEKNEFRKLVDNHKADGIADVVLTNPPFAKEYSRNQDDEDALLDDYVLAFDDVEGSRKKINSLSSMVMFLERYHDLLAPGGRLITVLDDSILAAPRHARTRRWILDNWVVKAVVSLPGDAFQRSQARVKTSILVLQKKTSAREQQPAVFMYYCSYVGVDDPARQRLLPIDEENRAAAIIEIKTVAKLFADFEAGGTASRVWTVPANALGGRFDVKACLPERERRVNEWESAGYEVRPLGELLTPVIRDDDTSRVVDPDSGELVTYLRVRYDGFCEAGEELSAGDVGGAKLTRVEAGDIVFSHINSIHGAVAIVPEALVGCVVTNEFTICRPAGELSASVIWSLVRSSQARAELILLATGIGRTRVRWAELAKLRLPIPGREFQLELEQALKAATDAEARASRLRAEAAQQVATKLLLDDPDARTLIAAFRPPR